MRRGAITFNAGQEHRNELKKMLDKFQYQFNVLQVWDDMIYFCASSLSQVCQWVQEREDEYLRRMKRYPVNLQKLFPSMYAELVLAFEKERFADVLGEMYMQLELGNDRKGQFFTPYNVCLMMSKMMSGNPAAEIEENGFIPVSDPTCGSGAMLIAFAQNCLEQGVNYQQSVLFVGQDVDPVVARMCYVQLALLGCAGYVVIGNSLTNPAVGDVLLPVSDSSSDIWYTPMFFNETWYYRRFCQKLKSILL